MTRNLGWISPTLEDLDKCKLMGRASNFLAGAEAKSSSDLFRYTVNLDQGGLGSCVTQTIAQTVRGKMAIDGIKDPPIMSRLMPYYLSRYREGTVDEDSGTRICTAFDVIADIGWAPEEYWPYIEERFKWMPSSEAFRQASDQRGKVGVNYHAITSTGNDRIDDVRKALSSRFMVTFGAPVSNAFCSSVPTSTIHIPDVGDIAGGHAQTIIGHEDNGERFKVKNSWGDHGDPSTDPGCAWFGYDYIKWSYSRDLYIVTVAPKGTAV